MTLITAAASTVLIAALLSVSKAAFYRDVTADNFDKLIDSSAASIMLEFYAPWCGHCKNLAPEYEQLGETFEQTPNVIIAQVDADEHKKLATRFDVKGFPTLKWIPQGSDVDKPEDVNAGRTAEELLKFVNEKTGLSKKLKAGPESAVTTLTGKNFDKLAKDTSVAALVGFFAPWCGHCKAIKPTWEKLATLYADEKTVVVGAVDCDAETDLAQEHNIEGFPTIKYFGRDGVEAEDYSGGRELDDLIDFINEKAGLDLTADGGVTATGGVVEEIAEHVKSYVSASTAQEREQAVETCTQAVEGLSAQAQNNFKYYAKVFAKVTEKGREYITKEKDRLSKMLKNTESLKGSQKRSFMRRINVLSVFDEL